MWTLDRGALVPLWRPRAATPGAVLLFSTRLGGVSPSPYDTMNLGRSTEDDPAAVTQNRERLLGAAGLSPTRLATAGQGPGAPGGEVTRPGHHPDCDALATRVPGTVLAVTTADCMSILYQGPGAVAAAHRGWG